MFFEKNVQALLQTGEVHRFLVQQLQQTEPTDNCELQATSDGNYTLQYQGVFLHHPEQPLAEVQESFKTNCKPGNDRLHLILGIGLGYLIDHAFQASSGHILVYEPDLPLLRFILNNVDLSEILESSRVWLASTQMELLTLIRKQIYRQYQLDIVMLRGSAYLLASEIPALMDAIEDITLDSIHDFKTGQHFHLQWIQQLFQNYPDLARYDTLDQLVGLFPKKPALVISRGPSLDSALDSIKRLAGSAVLIAVGSAIRRLWEADIIPDFAVFYDANGIQEQLYGIPTEVLEQITFLVSPTTQPCCFETPSYGKLVFLTQNNMQISDWIDQIFQKKHNRLEGGGTVSLIAFQTALVMQCNPIVLVGQDLAFPGNQVYAGGIPLQVNEEGYMALTPNDTLYAEPETLDTVTGQYGETLKTLKAYKSFIRHFEDLAVKNAKNLSPVKLYNASKGGAHIEGYPLCNLSDFITHWSPWKPGHALSEKPGLSEAISMQRNQQLQQGLHDLKIALHEALILCRQLQDALQKNHPSPTQALEEIQASNRALNLFLQNQPFVAYLVMFEMIEFRRKINTLPSDEMLPNEGRIALIELIENCHHIIETNALAWVSQAEKALAEMEFRIQTVI
jgi:hypothetical protein